MKETLWAACFAGALGTSAGTAPLMEGMIQLNGQQYRAMCHCADEMNDMERVFYSSAPICNPNKVQIYQDRNGSDTLSLAEVRSSYGQPVDVVFAKVGERFLSCMDSRITDPSLSTPGGDLGEFLLTLGVGTEHTDRLDEDQVTKLLNSYLSSLPPHRMFYACTDDAAVAHLEKTLGVEGLNIVSPSVSQRKSIANALANPANIGDTHFRSLIKKSSAYGIEPELALWTLRSFFGVLWDDHNPNQKKLLLDVLPGAGEPQALLEVSVSPACEAAGVSALLTPKTHANQVAIWNATAGQVRRREILNFFNATGLLPNLTLEQVETRLNRRAALWAAATSALEAHGTRFSGKEIAPQKAFYRLLYV